MINKVITRSLSNSQNAEQVQDGKEALAIQVFDLFRRIAENPIMEIGGRAIWSDNKGNLSNSNQVNLVEVTQCTTTVQALLVALFGPEDTHQLMDLWKGSNAKKHALDPEDLKHVYADIQKKGDSIRSSPSTSFYAYTFGLFRNPKPSMPQASNHLFLIVQYTNNEGRYCTGSFKVF